MSVTASGHDLPDHLLELQQDFFGALDAGADGELGVDVDLALVGLRQQLDADQRVEQHGGDDQRRGAADDGRPMVQRHVDQPCGSRSSIASRNRSLAR